MQRLGLGLDAAEVADASAAVLVRVGVDHLAPGAGRETGGRRQDDDPVEIVAEAFRDKPLLERHRMIYATLSELIESDIHALSIKASAPNS